MGGGLQFLGRQAEERRVKTGTEVAVRPWGLVDFYALNLALERPLTVSNDL